MSKPKTFYQRATDQLLAAGYTQQRKAGVFRKPKAYVVLKSRATLERFRGYPTGVAALLVNADGEWALTPKDFHQLRSK